MACGSATISHQQWEKTDNHIPLVVPDVQATDHKTKALDDRKPAQDVGDFERRVETKLPEWHQPFMEGFKGGLQVRQTCLQLTWPYHRQHFLFPRILLQNLLSTKQEESTIYSLIFFKTRIAKYADARQLPERHAEEILTIARTELKLQKDLGI